MQRFLEQDRERMIYKSNLAAFRDGDAGRWQGGSLYLTDRRLVFCKRSNAGLFLITTLVFALVLLPLGFAAGYIWELRGIVITPIVLGALYLYILAQYYWSRVIAVEIPAGEIGKASETVMALKKVFVIEGRGGKRRIFWALPRSGLERGRKEAAKAYPGRLLEPPLADGGRV
ncbi:MAG: hypothetical protein ACT4P2_00360 [Pseudomonadota bacterium]